MTENELKIQLNLEQNGSNNLVKALRDLGVDLQQFLKPQVESEQLAKAMIAEIDDALARYAELKLRFGQQAD